MNAFVVAAFALALTDVQRADLASQMAYAVTSASSAPAPAPPAPKPSPSECPEGCINGWLGDGTIKIRCDNPECPYREKSAPPPTVSSSPPKVSAKPAPITISKAPGPRWNVEGNWNYSTVELADHLRREHGVNINGLTRSQLEAIHDNLHNGRPAYGTTQRRTSCPTGTCPTR